MGGHKVAFASGEAISSSAKFRASSFHFHAKSGQEGKLMSRGTAQQNYFRTHQTADQDSYDLSLPQRIQNFHLNLPLLNLAEYGGFVQCDWKKPLRIRALF